MNKHMHEQPLQPVNTAQGPVELEESQLAQSRGGAAFMKFDGIDGEATPNRANKVEAITIKQK